MHSPALHGKRERSQRLRLKEIGDSSGRQNSASPIPGNVLGQAASHILATSVRLPILELIAVPETHIQTQNTCSSTHHRMNTVMAILITLLCCTTVTPNLSTPKYLCCLQVLLRSTCFRMGGAPPFRKGMKHTHRCERPKIS